MAAMCGERFSRHTTHLWLFTYDAVCVGAMQLLGEACYNDAIVKHRIAMANKR